MKSKIKLIAASVVTTVGLLGLTAVSAFADDNGGDSGSMQNNWNWMSNGNGWGNGWGNGYNGNGWGLPPQQTVTGSVYGTTGAPVTVTLTAGWNLVDANVAKVSHAAVTDFWNGTSYQPDAIDAGHGIWVYVQSSQTINLPPNFTNDYTIQASAGGWTMIGNPFSTVETVTLQTGDTAYTYDPASNQYSAAQTGTLTLQPGQGTWLESVAGGTYTIGMTPPAPPSTN